MVSDARKKSMAWMETDYSKHTYFRWKVKWRLEHLGVLGIMGETAPLTRTPVEFIYALILMSVLYKETPLHLQGYTRVPEY